MERTRRTLLAAGLALATPGCFSNLPRATGPRNPPRSPEGGGEGDPSKAPLYIEFGSPPFEATDDGNLLARVVVKNRTDMRRSTTVQGTVEVDGETYVQEEPVEVPGDGQTTVEFVYDVPYDAFQEEGEFSPKLV